MVRLNRSVWLSSVAVVLGVWCFALVTGFGVLAGDQVVNNLRRCSYLVATGVDARVLPDDGKPCRSIQLLLE